MRKSQPFMRLRYRIRKIHARRKRSDERIRRRAIFKPRIKPRQEIYTGTLGTQPALVSHPRNPCHE